MIVISAQPLKNYLAHVTKIVIYLLEKKNEKVDIYICYIYGFVHMKLLVLCDTMCFCVALKGLDLCGVMVFWSILDTLTC